jgi:hypothetical protein
MIGEQGEVSTLEHAGGKVAHDRFSLYMQISEHFIRAPPANELDAVGVDVGTKECHGTRGSQGSGRDMVGEETVGWSEDSGSKAQQMGKVRRRDASEAKGARVLVGG